MTIEYSINSTISASDFVDVLQRSGLAERRPVDNRDCIQGMLDNCDLLVTAWDEDKLVGVARSMTDFHYACYMSDLAVDKAYQKRGIGLKMQAITQQQNASTCRLILIAAPAAATYYHGIGYSHNPRCWVLEPEHRLGKSES